MSSCNNNRFVGSSSGNQDTSLARHISRFIGETVTIFTTSGGASGCGFTGVVLSVNNCFVRLVTDQGMAPNNPLAENICGEMDNGSSRERGGLRGLSVERGGCNDRMQMREVGSVCDIPIDRIAAFCHNAVS
jgi:hypothetical protein